MEFGILGPLEVLDEGRPVPLRRGKERALLAILLLHANETVSSDQLIDELWGEEPPESAIKALHYYVSRLRKALEPDRAPGTSNGLIVTRGSGYELRLERDRVDVGHFEQLAQTGRRALDEANPAAASESLREALGLWRGPALADLRLESFALPVAERLEEFRVSVLEDWFEAELVLGHHARLVGELEALIAEYPLRERFRLQLMLALYRSDRQAEALDAYQEARRILVEQLGIEPTPSLQRLQKAILAQDPALEVGHGRNDSTLARPTDGDERPAEPAPAHGARLRARVLVGAALVAAGLTSLVLVQVMRSDSDSTGPDRTVAAGRPATSVTPDSLVGIDPDSNTVAAVIPVGMGPQALAVDDGSLWVANRGERTVSRVELASGKVVRTIGVALRPDALVAGAGAAWVGSSEARVARIDRETSEIEELNVLDEPALGLEPAEPLAGSLAAGYGDLWIGISNALTILRLDMKTGRIRATIRGIAPWAMTAGRDALWALDRVGKRVARIDPHSNRITASIAVRGSPAAIAVDEPDLWVLADGAARLWRINGATRRIVAGIPVAATPGDGLAIGDGAVWVTQRSRGRVIRVDPATNRVVATVDLRHLVGTRALGIGGGRVWVAVGEPLR